MKKALAFSMAAVMALSSSVCVYSEGRDEAELKTMLLRVKDRIEVPVEMEKFDYRVSSYAPKDEYTFTWTTPDNAEEYKYMSCTICSTVITDFHRSDVGGYSSDSGVKLAALSADSLYARAVKAVKQLNPTVAKNIMIDKDSLSVSLRGSTASFRLVRIKNGIPMDNDSGTVVLDKNTGELSRFQMNWHPNASFRSSDKIISEDKAKDAYADMIAIRPQYEIYFDSENKAYVSRIVYRQDDYGEINAFTGNKSDFIADAYYDDITNDAVEEEADSAAPETGGEFTPQELAELNKDLPYSNEKAIVELMESNKYMSYNDGLGLSYSKLYKTEFNDNDIYVYTASFDNQSRDEVSDYDYTSRYESLDITVNAETGELMSYGYYDSDAVTQSRSFDEQKMTALAAEIAEKFAGDKYDEYGFEYCRANSYTDKVGNVFYYGSYFRWNRMVNDLRVNGDNINIEFSPDGVLTGYRINYSDVEFRSPEDILSADEVMAEYWENNDLNLYYLARIHDKITKTVLVYGTDSNIYCDAFTGEPIYSYGRSGEDSNISAISDKLLKNKAEILEAHGLYVTSGMKSEKDGVQLQTYMNLLNRIATMGVYGRLDKLPLSCDMDDDTAKITTGDAMVLFTAAECGTSVPELKGIFKSPYTDVSDSDSCIGYYAIAHALLGSGETVLGAGEQFTYADMIELVYDYLTE